MWLVGNIEYNSGMDIMRSAMTTGSFLAIVVQVYAGLYVFVFANLYWLLNSCIALRKVFKAKNLS